MAWVAQEQILLLA
jgi:hypothetical protein